MQEIIDWLVAFEDRASKFYIRASEYFSDDVELARLASEMAGDEIWHAEIITRAAKHYAELTPEDVPSATLVKIDIESRKRFDALFGDLEQKFNSGDATKRQFLETIIEAEYSEWNSYLLYVVNSVKGTFEEFATVPEKMSHHKGRIENYLSRFGDMPEAAGLIASIGRLPDLWCDRFLLVVEDDYKLVNLLKALLESKGVVDIACNGKEALELFNSKYYDATISDIDMPEMNGIDFYNRIKQINPGIKDRFLFFTGLITPEREAFFMENGVDYLQKPASIKVIIGAIDKLLKNSIKH